MKKVQKILLLIICIFLTMGAGKICIWAAGSEGELIFGNGNGITRAEWLHNLVTVFDMSVENGQYPDDYFSDLHTEDEYYEDVMTAAYFGVFYAETGTEVYPNEKATRDFAAHTLNFCLAFQLDEEGNYSFSDAQECEYATDAQIAVDRGWFDLIDGKFCPDRVVTADEAEYMLTDAQNVLDASEIDSNHSNTVEFAEDVKVIPNGTEVVIEDGYVVINEMPAETEICENDTFAVFVNDIPQVYVAKSVDTNESTLQIETEKAEEQEAIENIDLQGSIAVDLADIEPLDGAQLEYIDKKTGIAYQSLDALPYAKQSAKTVSERTMVEAKHDLKLSDAITASVTMEIEAPSVDFQINPFGTSSIVFTTETKLSFNLSGDLADADSVLKGLKNIRFVNCTVPGIGGFVVEADIEASGKISGVTRGYLTNGVAFDFGSGFRLVKGYKSAGFNITAGATASIGLVAKLGVTDMPVLKAYVYAGAGARANLKSSHYDDGKLPENCLNFSAYLYANCGATASIDLGFTKPSIDLKHEFFNEKNSPVRAVFHYEDGKEVSRCTRDPNCNSGYYTRGDSVYAGCGWIDGFGSSGYDGQGEPIQIYTYTLDENDQATVTGYKGNAVDLTVPSSLDGYTVVAIGDGAFEDNDIIRTVLLPETLVSIGSKAFNSCDLLESVSIPDSVTNIDKFAFRECRVLYDVELPEKLEVIGAGAFADCESLTNISIPAALQEIKAGIWGSQNYWGPFTGCSSLNNVSFEEDCTFVLADLFYGCDGLENIIIPDSITVIEAEAFANCTNLIHVQMPDTVTEIEDGVFSGCYSLSEINLSTALTTIGGGAFADCISLERITIPKTLQSVESGLSHYGRLYWGPFDSCTALKTVEFETGTVTVADSLFEDCDGLVEIVLPDSITNIGKRAFYNCINLESVQISAAVTEIGVCAFGNCTELQDVTLPASLESIGGGAFCSCTSLTQINIPKTLKTVKFGLGHYGEQFSGAFENCSALKNVEYENGITLIPGSLFVNCTGLETVQFPDTVTKVEGSALKGCINLKSAIFGDNITEVGTRVFYGCSALETVKLPNNCQEIPAMMFYGCKNLEEINLPSTIRYIRESAFEKSGLHGLELPDTVELIGAYVFRECENLEKINLNEGLTDIGRAAFEECRSIEEIVIPDSLKTLGTSTFKNCEKLSRISLGNGLTEIPEYGFYQCGSLEEIKLPYRIETVGNYAFANCTKLKEITMPRTVSAISSNAFSYPTQMTVYGVSGTYVESYAKEKGMKFVAREIHAETVSLNKTELSLLKGQNEILQLTVLPSEFTDEVVWKSTDTEVVTVDNAGSVTARAVGTATIKVTVGDKSAACHITVMQPVTKINLNQTSLSLEALESYELKASIQPQNASNQEIAWSSSEPQVVTVDENGIVKALKKGNAVITVKAQDGSNVSKTCTVTVTNSAWIVSSVQELESGHNYENNFSDYWIYQENGASQLNITFDERTELEEDFDFLYLYAKDGTEIGRYTGTELAGNTVTIPGDTVKIKLVSDGSGTKWGYKVTAVTTGEIKPDVESITLSVLSKNMTVGSSFQNTALIMPENADQTVVWESSNPEVASVENGVITAISEGETVITAKSSNGKTAECRITVSSAKGDVDGDGEITIFDASAIIDTIYGRKELDIELADMDGNGTVDVFDASYVIDMLYQRNV